MFSRLLYPQRGQTVSTRVHNAARFPGTMRLDSSSSNFASGGTPADCFRSGHKIQRHCYCRKSAGIFARRLVFPTSFALMLSQGTTLRLTTEIMRKNSCVTCDIPLYAVTYAICDKARRFSLSFAATGTTGSRPPRPASLENASNARFNVAETYALPCCAGYGSG